VGEDRRGSSGSQESSSIGEGGKAKGEKIVSIIKTGNFVHDETCNLSEMTRQVAVAAAAGNRAAIIAAEIAHYRTCLASAVANGCGREPFLNALRSLGKGGS
jgi:hypothetical protein